MPNAEEYEKRAAEFRERAQRETDPTAKRQLEEIAASYRELAKQARARAPLHNPKRTS